MKKIKSLRLKLYNSEKELIITDEEFNITYYVSRLIMSSNPYSNVELTHNHNHYHIGIGMKYDESLFNGLEMFSEEWIKVRNELFSNDKKENFKNLLKEKFYDEIGEILFEGDCFLIDENNDEIGFNIGIFSAYNSYYNSLQINFQQKDIILEYLS